MQEGKAKNQKINEIEIIENEMLKNRKYNKITTYLQNKLDRINSRECKIIKLKDGEENENLYLISGLNSGNTYNEWNNKLLEFSGNIYGLQWNNYWKEWDIIINSGSKEILKNIPDFVRGFSRITKCADDAGYFLANHIQEGSSNYIISHSMATRAAFSFLKYLNNKTKKNQILLFNGAVPHSETFFNFNSYASRAEKGIGNFYNYSDPILAVLAVINAPISGIISNTKLFGEKLAEQFAEPIGLLDSETVSENYNIAHLQGVEHSVYNIIDHIIIFDGKEKRFIFRENV